jgi:hypothetical protein
MMSTVHLPLFGLPPPTMAARRVWTFWAFANPAAIANVPITSIPVRIFHP